MGYYTSLCNPKPIPRYRCKVCGRSFSRQTFSNTYWLKHPERLKRVFMRLLSCSCNRQIAR
ncbi:MAG: hypothetical protein R6X25_05880, partial [Candidatus Krumholzibacteriia bacterium]